MMHFCNNNSEFWSYLLQSVSSCCGHSLPNRKWSVSGEKSRSLFDAGRLLTLTAKERNENKASYHYLLSYRHNPSNFTLVDKWPCTLQTMLPVIDWKCYVSMPSFHVDWIPNFAITSPQWHVVKFIQLHLINWFPILDQLSKFKFSFTF